MQEPFIYLTIAATTLLAIALLASTALRGWRDWLSLKRAEMDSLGGGHAHSLSTSPSARIELADLKERIKKLEAIAAGVDI